MTIDEFLEAHPEYGEGIYLKGMCISPETIERINRPVGDSVVETGIKSGWSATYWIPNRLSLGDILFRAWVVVVCIFLVGLVVALVVAIVGAGLHGWR